MADDCFIPYKLQLTRAEYAADVTAQRAKKGAGQKSGPDPAVQVVWEPSKVDVSADGTMGYTWGRYEFTTHAKDGKVSTAVGVYLTVWRRQADGSWKFVFDGSPDMPANPEALAKFLKRADMPSPPKP